MQLSTSFELRSFHTHNKLPNKFRAVLICVEVVWDLKGQLLDSSDAQTSLACYPNMPSMAFQEVNPFLDTRFVEGL